MFNRGKDKDASEQEKLGRTIANLSDQVGALQQQLLQKNKQVDELMEQLKQAQASATRGDAAAKSRQQSQQALEQQLRDAQAQMRALEGELSAARAQAEAAEAAAATSGAAASEARPAGGLAIGATAWVQNEQGQNLRRRSAPGLQASILDGLPVGTQLTLLEGPVSGDGYTWWRIRTRDGREGWVAGEGLVTHQ